MRQARAYTSWYSCPIESPQTRKPITIVTEAARTLFDVVPNRSRTRLAVAPSRFMCAIRRSANAFSSPSARLKIAMMTSAVGKHRQRDVGGRRRTRVPARLEVAAKPEQREAAEARVGASTQPIDHG